MNSDRHGLVGGGGGGGCRGCRRGPRWAPELVDVPVKEGTQGREIEELERPVEGLKGVWHRPARVIVVANGRADAQKVEQRNGNNYPNKPSERVRRNVLGLEVSLLLLAVLDRAVHPGNLVGPCAGREAEVNGPAMGGASGHRPRSGRAFRRQQAREWSRFELCA